MKSADERTRGRDLLVALWAAGEASFWFIAPDFLLLPFSIERPDRWRRWLGVAWCASLVGGILYFVFCTSNLALAESILAHTPFVTPRMLAFIAGVFDRYGPWGAMVQSWSFMSFKIWTFEAVRHDFTWWSYFPIVMCSRVFRLAVVSWAGARLSPLVRPIWMRHRVWWWALYAVGFLGMLVAIER